MVNPWLGVDIGGASVKLAQPGGFAARRPLQLWRRPDRLTDELRLLLSEAPPHAGVAVTMTGELADCFATKQEGVAHIVGAVEQAAPDADYYLAGGEFCRAPDALRRWREVAAANWSALSLAAPTEALIDIGSTTTDMVDRRTAISCRPPNDTDRLLSGGLHYVGVGRTPICAVVSELPYRGRRCPVAAELFATTGDAATVLGHGCDAAPTADGRPATPDFARARLARMVCADPADFGLADARAVAAFVVDRLTDRLTAGVRRFFGGGVADLAFTASGAGEWLALRAIAGAGGARVTPLSEWFGGRMGQRLSVCATAWAVAKLREDYAA